MHLRLVIKAIKNKSNKLEGFDNQDYVQQAIKLRKQKGLHSEFYYKLGELVDKIKQFKEKTKITVNEKHQEIVKIPITKNDEKEHIRFKKLVYTNT
jgi:hypothetical protein